MENKTTKLYSVGNYIFDLLERADGSKAIVASNVSHSLSVTFEDKGPQFTAWSYFIGEAKGSTNIRKAIEGTITDIFVLASLCPHDPELSNSIADAVDNFSKRITKAISAIEKEMSKEEIEKEAESDEAWMSSQGTLEEMADEAEKEKGNG